MNTNTNYDKTPHINNLINALEEGGQTMADRKKLDQRIASVIGTSISILNIHPTSHSELQNLLTMDSTTLPKDSANSLADRILGLSKQYTNLSSKQLIILNSILSKNKIPDIGRLLSDPKITEADLNAIAPYLLSVDLRKGVCQTWGPEKVEAFLTKCTHARVAFLPDGTIRE